MLRKTAAKAFGAGTTDGGDIPPARHETQPDAALERLFGEIHARLAELLKRSEGDRNASGDEAAEPEVGEGTAVANRAVRPEVTRPRALPEGVEFRLIGAAFSARFLNNMAGLVVVSTFPRQTAAEGAAPVRQDILSVHPQRGSYRAILKPLSAPSRRSPAAAGRRRRADRGAPADGGPTAALELTEAQRSAFCYTSAAELAAHYLELVEPSS